MKKLLYIDACIRDEMSRTKQVATPIVEALKEKYDVEMPIVDEVYNVLYNGENPQDAVYKLMQRDKKAEM